MIKKIVQATLCLTMAGTMSAMDNALVENLVTEAVAEAREGVEAALKRSRTERDQKELRKRIRDAAKNGDVKAVSDLFEQAEDKRDSARAILKGASGPLGYLMQYSRKHWNVELLKKYYPHYFSEEMGQTVTVLLGDETVTVPQEFIESSAALKAIMEKLTEVPEQFVDSHRALAHFAIPFTSLPLPATVTPELWKKIELFMPSIIDYYYIQKAYHAIFSSWGMWEEECEQYAEILGLGLRNWLSSLVDQLVTTSTTQEIGEFQFAALALDIPLLQAIGTKAYSVALRRDLERAVAHMPVPMRREFLYRTCFETLLDEGAKDWKNIDSLEKSVLDRSECGGEDLRYLTNKDRDKDE